MFGTAALVAAGAAHLLGAGGSDTGSAQRPPARAVPVVVTTVERRDVPVELEGLGTVQAYNTVTVKPRVTGQIVRIAFTEGQFVRRGEVLARIDPRVFLAQWHQAEAKRAEDAAQLANARRNLARLAAVVRQGYVSRQLVDDQRSQVVILRATLQADEAAIESAKVQLDYATVTAPIDGITGIRLLDVGNIISPADPGLVVITQVRPVAVIFSLPADIVATIGMGEVRGSLPVTAYDRDDRKALATGTLALVDNQIDRNSNTVRLKAIFDNAAETLEPGEFVIARLTKTVLRGAAVVPKDVVQYDERGAFAWLVRPDSTVEPRRVVVGPQSGDLLTIERGLVPGDRVVLAGQYNLRAGVAVTTQKHTTVPVPSSARGALSIP